MYTSRINWCMIWIFPKSWRRRQRPRSLCTRPKAPLSVAATGWKGDNVSSPVTPCGHGTADG